MSYAEYLQTDYWKQVAAAVKERADHRCQLCNSPLDLNAHHRTYEHRGNEMEHLGDLICLCYRCHQHFHGRDRPRVEVVSVNAPSSTSSKGKTEKFIEVTKQNCSTLNGRKPCYHWAISVGIDPTSKGWKKRAIGHFVPAGFFHR